MSGIDKFCGKNKEERVTCRLIGGQIFYKIVREAPSNDTRDKQRLWRSYLSVT